MLHCAIAAMYREYEFEIWHIYGIFFAIPLLIVFFSIFLVCDVVIMILTCRFLALFCECFGCCVPCWGQPPFWNPGSEQLAESSAPMYYSHQLLQPPNIVATQFQHAMASAPPRESV